MVIVCYLFYSGLFVDVEKCLAYFAKRRSAKGKGVTQPSQLRYIRYFCGLVSNKLRIYALIFVGFSFFDYMKI